MATQTSVPGTEENKATHESSSETTSYASALQKTVTRHLGNVSYYIVDCGVRVLGLEAGQGSARGLRGETHGQIQTQLFS